MEPHQFGNMVNGMIIIAQSVEDLSAQVLTFLCVTVEVSHTGFVLCEGLGLADIVEQSRQCRNL